MTRLIVMVNSRLTIVVNCRFTIMVSCRPCSHCPPALGLLFYKFGIPECWHFEDSAPHIIEHVHLDADGLLHVLVLTVNLLWVFFMTNLTSLDACILKMVPHI